MDCSSSTLTVQDVISGCLQMEIGNKKTVPIQREKVASFATNLVLSLNLINEDKTRSFSVKPEFESVTVVAIKN